jgi:hypothetical protein
LKTRGNARAFVLVYSLSAVLLFTCGAPALFLDLSLDPLVLLSIFGGLLKLISSLIELICYMCVFLGYLEGLQDEVTRSNVIEGADRLHQADVRMHEMARRTNTPRITGVKSDEDQDVIAD